MQAFRVIALLVTVALVGCSSATIDRVNGSSFDGMIVGGNRDYLYVLRDDDQMVKVRRAKVRDIDHPGNVLMVIGLPLVAMGLTYALLGAAVGANTPERDMFYTVGGSYGAIGAALAIPGYISWSSSKSAADPEDTLDTRQFGAVPDASEGDGDGSHGLHLQGALGPATTPVPLPAAQTPATLELRGGATP